MKKIQILYIGKHPEILPVVVRLLNSNKDWEGTGVSECEEAITAFNQNHFSLVLLGSGIDAQSEADLCTFFRNKNPKIPIVQHYGGGSGLLQAEIFSALEA